MECVHYMGVKVNHLPVASMSLSIDSFELDERRYHDITTRNPHSKLSDKKKMKDLTYFRRHYN